MNQQTIFIKSGDYAASQQTITPGKLKPSERLSIMLNTIGEKRILFSDSIRIKSERGNAVMHVLHISRSNNHYVAFVDLFKEKNGVPINLLPDGALTAITQRIRMIYANKLSNFSL